MNTTLTDRSAARVGGEIAGKQHSLSVYVRKLNVVIFFAIILQNAFKIS